MDILGIGPLELAFILIIALIVLGPHDMVKAGRTLGRFMRRVVTSDTWKVLTGVSREIRNLPNRLIREAGLEDVQQQLAEVREINRDLQQQIAEVRQVGLSIGAPLEQSIKPATGQENNPDEISAAPAALPEAAEPEPEPSAGLSAWTTPPPSTVHPLEQSLASEPAAEEPPQTEGAG
jgi:Sec-independent protein translocase protein TatA